MTKNAFLEAARKYEKPMVKFLREMIAIPSESAEEGPVIERIKKELNLTPAQEKHLRTLTQRRDKLTAEIEKAEARVHAINEMFCNPGFFDKTPAGEVKKLEAEQKTLNTKIEESMAEWDRLETELGELTPAPAVP